MSKHVKASAWLAAGISWLCVGLCAGWAHAQPVVIPEGAAEGLFLNVWAERFEGAESPRFDPAPHLEPETNYLFVVDIAFVSYDRSGGVVSLPVFGGVRDGLLRALEGGPPVITQLVVEDDRYRVGGRAPMFFSIHRYRAAAIGNRGLAFELAELEASERTRGSSDAMDMLRESGGDAPWVLEREVFMVRAGSAAGEAPIGIAIRTLDSDLIGSYSMRFCIMDDVRGVCPGLPRRSEYLEYAIARNPPDLPFPGEVDLRELEMATPPGSEERTLTWNSWVSLQGDAGRTPVESLALPEHDVPRTYRLQVDGSLYDYELELGGDVEGLGSAPADHGLARLVRERREEGATEIPLVVRAEVIGGAVEIVGATSESITLRLDRLDPDAPPPLPDPVTIAALSHATAAASFGATLAPVGAGCAAVAFSISDGTGVRPLESLVHFLAVGDPSGEGGACPDASVTLRSGLENLLAHTGAPPVDIAIHVFEVFPDGGSHQAAAFLIGAADEYFSWELERPISEYLQDPGNLHARILEARQRTNRGVEHAYTEAARSLASALFSGANPREQQKADRARDALERYVRESSQPPTVLARLTDRDGNPLFLPAGILGAPGPDAVVDKPLKVVLPLPVEDYGEAGCIGDWAIAVSDTLEGAKVPVPESIKTDTNWLGDSFDDLRGYASGDTPGGESLIVVAHHESGRIRYRENDFPLQTSDFRRRYGEASAAVLAMCEAGGVAAVDRRFIERLNRFGLDAAILSPFSLDANYGKAFAIEFARVVRDARDANREDTLGELFERAVSATAVAMENHPDPGIAGPVGDMGLELILTGNPSLELCTRE